MRVLGAVLLLTSMAVGCYGPHHRNDVIHTVHYVHCVQNPPGQETCVYKHCSDRWNAATAKIIKWCE